MPSATPCLFLNRSFGPSIRTAVCACFVPGSTTESELKL